ncbi:hypothetical protein LCGC14_1982900, partial [marine sediment metagenome]
MGVEDQGFKRPIRVARGTWQLLDDAGEEAPCQGDVAATWGTYPGGSNGQVKWMHLHFLADVPAGGSRQYHLEIGPEVVNSTRSDLSVADDADAVTITTGIGAGALRLVISRERFNVLDEVALDLTGDGFGPDDTIIRPRDSANLAVRYDHMAASINTSQPEVTVEKAGPVLAVVRVKVKLDGRFESIVRIYAYAGSSYVRIQETLIHGPTGQDRSAYRSQPVVMKSHALEFPLEFDPAEAVATFGIGEALPEPPQFDARAIPLAKPGRAALEQDLTHVCRKGNLGDDGLSAAFGYELFADGEPIHSGRRAPGWVDVSDGRRGVTAAVRSFWQTFPKRIVATAGAIRLEHWADGAQLDPVSRNFNWMGMAKTHDVG